VLFGSYSHCGRRVSDKAIFVSLVECADWIIEE